MFSVAFTLPLLFFSLAQHASHGGAVDEEFMVAALDGFLVADDSSLLVLVEVIRSVGESDGLALPVDDGCAGKSGIAKVDLGPDADFQIGKFLVGHHFNDSFHDPQVMVMVVAHDEHGVAVGDLPGVRLEWDDAGIFVLQGKGEVVGREHEDGDLSLDAFGHDKRVELDKLRWLVGDVHLPEFHFPGEILDEQHLAPGIGSAGEIPGRTGNRVVLVPDEEA